MILLQFWTISLPYKLCLTEKRTYANWNSIYFNSICCQYLLINYLDSSAENLHSSAEIEPSQENSALLRNFFSVNLQKSQHPPPPPPPPNRYGNTGCRVFKQEIQNWKDFCIKIYTHKGNYCILKIGLMGRCQKVPNFDFQSQFSMSKIIRIFFNFFFSWKNTNLGAYFLLLKFFNNISF